MIYLATPYSHPEAAVRESRFRMACSVTGRLIAQGEVVFSPIVQGHSVAETCSMPTDFKFWEKFDRSVIRLCSKVVVVKMDGWAESVGVSAEIRIAEELHKPVEFIEV